ncbi:DNA-binding protein [Motiliproteus sediminis]|uniref:DNA-binding protein n=1 Tax=Motiliproteus sediminis TaxID=1468178 RepID=UPI001AEF67A5|nr:DNA-binding protein [Motiliproteus sediminis]
MSVDIALVHRLADRLLNEGRRPDVEVIAEQVGLEPTEPELIEALERWWGSIEGRVQVLETPAESIPDSFQRALKLLWQDAVREATRHVNNERRSLDQSLDSIRRESESAISGSRADYETLEHRFQVETARADEAAAQVKMLEAEITVLKANLSGEVVQRKQYEEKVADYKAEVRRSEKLAEEARRTFDQRLKEEQTHCQDQLAKTEAELSHVRRMLEQARDQSGKKDAALTRNLHDLQTEIVKRDVKLETLQGQIKSLEGELKLLRSEHASQRREITKLNASLLSESNKNKRNDETVRQLQEDLKREQQRLSQTAADANRKELELRNQVKARDDELLRTRAALNSAQKKQVTQEEVIRRLSQQAGA